MYMAQACIHVFQKRAEAPASCLQGNGKKGQRHQQRCALSMSLPLGVPVFRSISIVCNRSDSIWSLSADQQNLCWYIRPMDRKFIPSAFSPYTAPAPVSVPFPKVLHPALPGPAHIRASGWTVLWWGLLSFRWRRIPCFRQAAGPGKNLSYGTVSIRRSRP